MQYFSYIMVVIWCMRRQWESLNLYLYRIRASLTSQTTQHGVWWHCNLETAENWIGPELNIMAVTGFVPLSQCLNQLSYISTPMEVYRERSLMMGSSCHRIVALHILREWHRLPNCNTTTSHWWSGENQHFVFVAKARFVSFTPCQQYFSDIMSGIWCIRWEGEIMSLHFYRLNGSLTSHTI